MLRIKGGHRILYRSFSIRESLHRIHVTFSLPVILTVAHMIWSSSGAAVKKRPVFFVGIFIRGR